MSPMLSPALAYLRLYNSPLVDTYRPLYAEYCSFRAEPPGKAWPSVYKSDSGLDNLWCVHNLIPHACRSSSHVVTDLVTVCLQHWPRFFHPSSRLRGQPRGAYSLIFSPSARASSSSRSGLRVFFTCRIVRRCISGP